MNVFYNAAPLLGPRTGIGRYCEQLMSAVSELEGITSHYYFRGNWGALNTVQPPASNSFLRNLILSTSEKWPKLASATYSLRHRLDAHKFNKGIASRSGVYHEPNFISYKSKLPTVLTVHDLSVLKFPGTHPAYRVAVFGNLLTESVLRADMIITDSEYVRTEVVQEFGIPSHKVVAVPLAASPNFKPVAQAECRAGLRRLGLPAQGYILAVGTLEPRKNIVSAIRAYSSLPKTIQDSFPFVITGMRGWRNGELDREAEKLLLQGKIILTGFVPDNLLPVLYSGASVLVYPSLYEGFGLPPLEAMACGTPVVVSSNSSIAEVVSDAGIGVDAADVDAIGGALLEVLENSEVAKKLSALGLSRAGEFSWTKCAQQTADIYRQVS